MSQLRTISLINRGKGIFAPIPRPVKTGVISTEIDVVMLENPKSEDIKAHRSSGWHVAYETFVVVPTGNGIRTHHFMRLEKVTPVASA